MTDLLSKHIDAHVAMNAPDKKLFFEALVPHTIRKKHFLLKEQEICKHEYFVIKGGLCLYELEHSGNQKVVYFGFEDWWITDKYSLLTGNPSVYHLQAIEDTALLSISKEKLEKLFQEIPKLESYFHKVLQITFATWQLHTLLMHKSATEKYQLFKGTYGALEDRLPQQLIASYLGMTRETLNRVKNNYAQRQLNKKSTL